MGVRINGVWHEELANPETGGTDNGNGNNFTSPAAYSQAVSSVKGGMGNVNTSVGGGGGGSPAVDTSALTGASATGGTGGGLQQLLNALAAGNVAAANEAIRQFNVTSGLDAQKFAQDVSKYSQDHAMAMTKQSADIAAQAAGISGMFNGAPTEAARQFNVSAQQAAQQEQDKTGLGMLTLASSLHADPFRQVQTMYGGSQVDGVNRAVQGLTGQYGLPGAFTAPGAAGNTATLGGLSQSYANAPAQYAQNQSFLANNLQNPNQIIAREYNNAPQNVKDFTTSGLSANTGLDQASLDKQIQKNLPQFNAPSFGLSAV